MGLLSLLIQKNRWGSYRQTQVAMLHKTVGSICYIREPKLTHDLIGNVELRNAPTQPQPGPPRAGGMTIIIRGRGRTCRGPAAGGRAGPAGPTVPNWAGGGPGSGPNRELAVGRGSFLGCSGSFKSSVVYIYDTNCIEYVDIL